MSGEANENGVFRFDYAKLQPILYKGTIRRVKNILQNVWFSDFIHTFAMFD